MSLYHYTDKSSAKAIMNSGEIKKSTKANGDAVFGDGVYLTSIPPNAPKSKIVQNNWDGMKNFQRQNVVKTQVAIEIPKALIPGVAKQRDQNGRDIWLYPGDISIQGTTPINNVRKQNK